MMAVVGGRSLYEYGDLTTVSYLASVRKSVLAMLYGNYVANGTIKLNKSLADLSIDDIGGLLPVERTATVADLLGARSGVYHEASNPGDNLADAPPRGSQKPGTYFLYSNWDFNALGTIFEQETGQNIYDALEKDIVRPIGMRDFDRATHQRTGDAARSQHLAYHMNFSTRDMARLGYVMLRDGEWNGRQIVPARLGEEDLQHRDARRRDESCGLEERSVRIWLPVVGVGREGEHRRVRRRVHRSGRVRSVHHRPAEAGHGHRTQDRPWRKPQRLRTTVPVAARSDRRRERLWELTPV